MEFWKRYGLRVTVALLALGTLGMWGKNRELYAQMENQRLRAETMEQELQFANRQCWELSQERTALQEELRQLQAGSVVSAYALEVTGVEDGKLLVDVSLDLALADRNTTVAIGGSVKEITLTRTESGTYSGRLEVPLDAEGVTLRLSTSAGGVKRSEVLAKYSSVTELLPVRMSNAVGDVLYNEADGKFCFTEWSLEVRDGSGESAEITDPAIRVYRNDELVLEDPCHRADDQPERYWDAVQSSALDCRNGDTIEFRFACTDRLGLGYEFPMKWWEIRDGKSVEHWPTTAYPTLTWPEK